MSSSNNNNNFKAVLKDAGDCVRPQQLLYCSEREAQTWGERVIDSLTPDQKKTAFVMVSKVMEVPVMEIHAAKMRGEYAVSRYGVMGKEIA